jgi:hypothetical protein
MFPITLNANDFDCKPDGRFLERASIEVDSTVLEDLDGILRVEDVGKRIAIPGAIDLVTTIVRLPEYREVKNAHMEAGSSILSGILIDPCVEPIPSEEPFSGVHVGRRITVAGAGPGGQTLITDIVAVNSNTEIQLASPALAEVSNVKVILNRGDRVTLGDYARRSVNSLTLDLGDRTINDGEMIIGGRALTSNTAKFSSEDLNKTVTIKDAGLLVTTIQSFQSSTQVTLAAPARRKVSDGMVDIWKTDSRQELEDLLASLDNLQVESADIVFGPGVYDFTRIEEENGPINAAIGLLGKKNLTIRGAGMGVTILRLMPQQDLSITTHLIETVNCSNITFRDLSVHGAYLTMAKTNEQVHCITLNEGSENITVERVRVFQSAGDGIRFLGRQANPTTGSVENKVRNVQVKSCQLIQNKRSGLAFQRAVEFVTVRNSYIEMSPPSTDSCIDLEPSGLPPTDIVFESNVMAHATPPPAVSLSGSDGTNALPARRIRFSDNEINGGNIFCTNINQLTIQNNTVRIAPIENVSHIPLHIAYGGDSLIVTGNLLVNDNPNTRSVILLEGVKEVQRALVANNMCFARAGRGIQCLSSDDITIEGNMIVATDSCNSGIFIRSESSDTDHISVRNNDITVKDTGTWDFGIRIASSDDHYVGPISIIGNSIHGAGKGIRFEGANYRQAPVCSLNRVAEDVLTPFDGITNLPVGIVVGGVASKGKTTAQYGAGRWIIGLGSPEGKIFGNVGDIFQSLDGEPDGAVLWVKQTGHNTADGWEPK